MKRLVIIDGNAILHRAYHALPPLTDPEGNIINAVYGFTSMLLKLFTDLKPSHIAVTFDRPAPTFRKEMFKEYQAHRPKMDEELVPQVEKVHDVVRAMGIPIFEKDGYEADDCIGTIVSKFKVQSSKFKVNVDQIIIVTGDRDILQLVREGEVFVYMPTKGLSEAKLYGEKEVEERMGVKPKQIPDFKALAGDSSDNYPGVGGIGPKTAVDLLKKFGSIGVLYKKGDKGDWGNMGDKVIEKLKSGKDSALLSHELATIKTDVPIDIVLPEISTLNTEEARGVFQSLGFKTLLRRLTGEESKKQEARVKKQDKSNKKDKSENENQQSLF